MNEPAQILRTVFNHAFEIVEAEQRAARENGPVSAAN